MTDAETPTPGDRDPVFRVRNRDLVGPDDGGHLLTPDEWDWVSANAHTHARAAAQTTTRLTAVTVQYLPAKYHGGAQTPTVQVVHDAETPISDGYAVSIGKFFAAGPTAGTSAHRMIGPNVIVRMLDLDVIGYHCGPAGNRGTVGYEQCGYARFTRADWTTADGLAQLDTLAAEIARDAEALGIRDRHLTDDQLRAWAAAGRPLALGGRCTHHQIARVLGGTTHGDPDPNYPYDLLNAAVTRHRNPSPEPEDPMAGITLDDIGKLIDQRISLLMYGDDRTDVKPDTHPDNLQKIRQDIAAGFQAVNDKLDALTPPKPDPTPGA